MPLFASIVVLSCIYSVLAVGFVIIYRASRVLNFAYADLALLIAYLTITFVTYLRNPLSLAIGLSCGFIIGLGIYALFIRPMAGESVFTIIILTVALGIVIKAIIIFVWGVDIERLSLGWKAYYQLPGNVHVSGTEIITITFTVVLYTALGAIYKFSNIGRQMRATAEDLLLSSQRGIDVYLITGIAWGLGVFVTGAAGILFGANYGISLQMGDMAIKGIAVALVGGLDSIKGTLPAGFVVALTELLTSSYINPRLGETTPFIILVIILIIRPWGFWGTKEELERV